MARVRKRAPAGQREAAVRARAGNERRGEVRLGQREPDADIAAFVVAVRRVDPDVDRLVGVGERPDPRADVGYSVAVHVDGVDAAVHAAQRVALVHRDVRLTQRAREERAVEQVTGPHPLPPFGHDVELEARRVLVELPHTRIARVRIEVRTGQRVERRDDADVGDGPLVRTAEHLGQRGDVLGADVPRARFERHDERQVAGADPLREQRHLRVAEDRGGSRAVGEHGCARDRGRRDVRGRRG